MPRRQGILDPIRQDVLLGLRQLRTQRLTSVAALVTIALAIGATTAIFSVVDAVLLRPLPYRDVGRLVVTQMSLPEFRDLRQRQRSYDALTAWASNRYAIPGERPEEVLGAQVEPGFFSLLMQPELGHGIGEDETRSAVAVISDALWRRRFDASPGVLGESLTMSGESYTIVGVMPRSFQYPDAGFDVWVPLEHAMAGTVPQLENRSLRIFRVIGRLRDGVTPAAASGELTAISEHWQREHPATNTGVLFTVTPLAQYLLGDVRPRLTLLLVAVSFVLLIACVNVASLVLGTTERRGREMALRRALGAPRARLLRQLLTESAVLALLGGLGGVVLAAVLLRLLPFVPADVPRLGEVTLDVRVLLFSLAVSLGAALLFGIAPAVQGSRGDLREAMQEGGRGAIGGRAGGRLRALLVAAEVAISIVVLVGAGLLVRSLVHVLDQEIGIRADGLVHANVGLFYFDDETTRVATLDRVLERVAALDGVRAAVASSGLPPQTAQRGTGFTVPGRAPDTAEEQGAYWVGVTPGYFEAVGGRVVRGRDVDARDRAGGLPVALVNESFARRLFGDGDAVGRQIVLTNAEAGGEPRTIVGVVNDIRYGGVEEDAAPAIYTPFAQRPFLWAYLMVRTDTPAERLAPALRAAVGAVDARMTPSRVVQHTELVSSLVAQRRFVTALLGSFALVALLLAAVGVYGVTATAVARRRREIGMRMALGARPPQVVRQVVGRELLLVAAGLAVGVVVSRWLTPLLAALLFRVEARDPATFLVGAGVMVAVALAASALPAARAASVDPATALREP